MRAAGIIALSLIFAVSANAAVTKVTTHGDSDMVGLAQPPSSTDLINGLIGVEQAGDTGWHPALGDATQHVAEKLPAFTDGLGDNGSKLTGLMNDFPGAGNPAKLVRYSLGSPQDIGQLRIYSGNYNGKDGRVFSTTVVLYSTNNGGTFQELGYFQSDPSGATNYNQTWGSTLVQIYDDANPTLLSGVTDIQFNLYPVHRDNNMMSDPFTGVNPFTGVDDTMDAAFVSPLIWELDVLQVPEPATMGLLALGGLFLGRRARRA